jgi:hypothetical protein
MTLDSYPDDADDNIHAFAFPSIVFEAPHAVGLLIPEGLCCRMHATTTHVRLAVGARSRTIVTSTDMRLLLFVIGTALGLVEGCCRHQVLDDGRVDNELVGRALGVVRGRRLGDQRFKDRVDDGGIPFLHF